MVEHVRDSPNITIFRIVIECTDSLHLGETVNRIINSGDMTELWLMPQILEDKPNAF
jgi:hypothetical protein